MRKVPPASGTLASEHDRWRYLTFFARTPDEVAEWERLADCETPEGLAHPHRCLACHDPDHCSRPPDACHHCVAIADGRFPPPTT